MLLFGTKLSYGELQVYFIEGLKMEIHGCALPAITFFMKQETFVSKDANVILVFQQVRKVVY
jgi:hypothetical protein